MSNPAWKDPMSFAFNERIRNSFDRIRAEALKAYHSGLFYKHVASEESDAEERKLSPKWDTFGILKLGDETLTTKHAPFTHQLIMGIPEIVNCARGLVYFSAVPARGNILPHSSGYELGKVRIRHQLCLRMPKMEKADEVYLEVNGERRTWEEGEILSFDDGYSHNVKNSSDGHRIVLLYDSLP